MVVLSHKVNSHNEKFLGGRKSLLLLLVMSAVVCSCQGFLSPPSRKQCSVTRSAQRQNKPSEFSVDDDYDDNYSVEREVTKSTTSYTPPPTSPPPTEKKQLVVKPKKNIDSNDAFQTTTTTIRRPKRIKQKKVSDPSSNMVGTNWMEKNAKFNNEDVNSSIGVEDTESSPTQQRQSSNKFKREIADTKTFREDFRKTRVFVQGIPDGASWQDLKDHFKQAGNVVFASVSVDVMTGKSKGHGIVQYETSDMAQNAIHTMRDYPLNGSPLYVREDVQENNNPNARLRPSSPSPFSQATPPAKWKCANEDNAEYMSEEQLMNIEDLIKTRDDARKRRKYDVSDQLRDELKSTHGVFIDDRLKMWWTSVDGKKVPQTIQDVNGDGGWNIKKWRQIPTTPENDACINPDMVEGLLKQRDVARREKDFGTADRLLEEARTAPDGDLILRIHDESRTWRAWTESRPPVGQPYDEDRGGRRAAMPTDPAEAKRVAAKECAAIVREYAPEKLEEIVNVLRTYPGREFQVLKRLKNQYLS